MTILITGAIGFIGSNLATKLLGETMPIVGIDNFDPFYDIKIKEKNRDELLKNKSFTFFDCDLNDSEKLSEIIKSNNVTLVVHLAAKAGVRPSLLDPRGYCRANVEGTLSLLEACRENNVKKIVFASSSSVYGKNKKVPFSENHDLESLISVYATTKLAGENILRMYHNLYGFDVAMLRFFTVYGPGQRPDLAIHKFLKANLKGEEITMFGDGSMKRDYTYIDDTVQGIENAIAYVKSNDNLCETFNLGNNTPISLSVLIAAIEKTTGKKMKVKTEEVPLGDVPITYADIEKSKKELGYNPKTSLDFGLAKFKDWMESYLANE